MRLGGRRVRSGTFGRFPCALRVVWFVRVRSAHFRAPWGSYDAIPLRRGGLPLRSVAFRTFLCAPVVVGFVRSNPVRRSCTFGPFPCALGDGSVRSVNFRSPWRSFGLFGCIRHIPVRPRCRRVRSVHSREPWGSSGSFLCVRSIPVRHSGRGVCSCAVVPFPFALGFVRVRSVHSPAPCEIVRCVRPIFPCALGCVGSIPCARGIVGFVRVRSDPSRAPKGELGPFPCALRVDGFVRVHSVESLVVVGFVHVRSVHSRAPWGSWVRSVHSRSPWGSLGYLGCVRFIPVRPGVRRVRWCAFGSYP